MISHDDPRLLAALAYARAGYRVFPCYSVDDHGHCTCGNDCGVRAGKHPMITGWQLSATTDEKQIRRWFGPSFGGVVPNVNIGILTGAANNLVVIDIDGAKGAASLAALEAQHGPLPVTAESISGSGVGRHLICQHPTDVLIENSVSVVAPGIDIRGVGGLFIAPPSRHASGKTYAWKVPLVGTPLAELPAWAIVTAPKPTAADPAATWTCSDPAVIASAAKYVAQMKIAVQGEDGSGDAYRVACVLCNDYALSVDDAYPIFVEYSNHCLPPWPEDQIWHKLKSAANPTKKHDQPRGCKLTPKELAATAASTTAAGTTAAGTTAAGTTAAGTTAPDPDDPLGMPLAERFRQFGTGGPRLTTGFPTFDEDVRGGLPSQRLVAVGGAPGAGKTTWIDQLALQWAQAGVHVAIIAADEEPNGLATRIGQQLGFDRRKLEDGDPDEKEAAARAVESLPNLRLVDGNDTGIEEVSAALAKQRGPTGQSALFVDSIQTVRSAESVRIRADSQRTRIDAVIEALKQAAKVDGHLVIATSELNRGAYRSKKESDRVEDLAAFKESGGIEYGASVCLVLRSVPNVVGVVKVTVPKNRLGSKRDEFCMTIDFTRASFRESAAPAEDTEEQVNAHYRQLILAVVADGQPRTKRAIFELTKGSKPGIFETVDRLAVTGEIRHDGKLYVCLDAGRPRNGSGSQKVPKGPRTQNADPSGTRDPRIEGPRVPEGPTKKSIKVGPSKKGPTGVQKPRRSAVSKPLSRGVGKTSKSMPKN